VKRISPASDSEKIRVWDGWIRGFHWSLVIAVFFQLVSGDTGWQFFEWHRYTGEFVLLLLLFRFGWSVIGSSNANLLALVVGPRKIISQLASLVAGRVTAHRGHDAPGGWAVIALLSLVLVQAVSGMFIADEEELIEGSFYGVLSSQQSDWLYRLHKWNAQLLQLVVLIHILAVGLYALRARRNLLLPMITGSMHWPRSQPLPVVRLQRAWRGWLLALFCLGGVGWLFSWW